MRGSFCIDENSIAEINRTPKGWGCVWRQTLNGDEFLFVEIDALVFLGGLRSQAQALTSVHPALVEALHG